MSDELLTESEKQQIAVNAVEAWDRERASSFAAPSGSAARVCRVCICGKNEDEHSIWLVRGSWTHDPEWMPPNK